MNGERQLTLLGGIDPANVQSGAKTMDPAFFADMEFSNLVLGPWRFFVYD